MAYAFIGAGTSAFQTCCCVSGLFGNERHPFRPLVGIGPKYREVVLRDVETSPCSQLKRPLVRERAGADDDSVAAQPQDHLKDVVPHLNREHRLTERVFSESCCHSNTPTIYFDSFHLTNLKFNFFQQISILSFRRFHGQYPRAYPRR